MHRPVLGILASIALLGGGMAADATESATVIDFAVLRDGSPFGHCTLSIRRIGDRTEVDNVATGEVRWGPWRFYTYDYRSHEVWRGGQLLSMAATTRDDGKEIEISAENEGAGLRVRGPGGDIVLPGDTAPTSFWTVQAARSSRLFDTKTGALDRVETVFLGREADDTENAGRVDHYRMTGDLASDLWYDDSGLLAKARFTARGSQFDYVRQVPETGGDPAGIPKAPAIAAENKAS